MANLNSQFIEFEKKISITPSKKDLIKDRHIVIRRVISEYFKAKEGFNVPDFFIQGSYKMDTMVQKKDGSFDVDLGVYFSQKPSVDPTIVQQYVLDAVKKHTSLGAQHLRKCIRLNYAGEFNLDLPVYYQINSGSQAYIAVKIGVWAKDDPEKFIDWVSDQRKKKEINHDGQLLRVIKYLKRWANLLPFKTPSGVALTVWACEHFSASKERDDEALSKTISNLYNSFWWDISCRCPVEPYDNLLENLDSSQKDKFKVALGKFKDDAAKAISSVYAESAAIFWQNHLGDKFKY